MEVIVNRKLLSRVLLTLICALTVAALVLCAIGCAPKSNPGVPTPSAEKASVTPEVDEYGIVTAEAWKDIYPNQYASYMQNADNTPPYEEYVASEDTTSQLPDGYEPTDSGKANYLADDQAPEIKTLGKGYGYAKYYTEPAGHVYSLWTVTHNGRVNEKTKAGCLTCKTPQFSSVVDAEGDAVFKENFWEHAAPLTENVSCASCHGNDPTTLEVDRAGWVRAMGNDTTASLEGQVCGQCHCDYSMDPVTSVPTSPYDNGRPDMVPDKMLAWYDAHDYADWTYETTGAKMISARHAEYEFCYGGEGSHMINLGYDCNDCHMAATYAEDGTAYTDHHWISPLENDELIERDCSNCHADIKAEVKAWQTDIDGRTHQLGLRSERFIKNFEAAINEGKLTPDQLAQLQKMQRDACFYWNLAAAENSEGAHNPAYYEVCLTNGNTILDQADKILGVTSVVAS